MVAAASLRDKDERALMSGAMVDRPVRGERERESSRVCIDSWRLRPSRALSGRN